MTDFLVPLVPKRLVSFDGMQVGLPQNQWLTLLDHVDISQWRELTLLVNVHSNNIGGGNAIYIYAVAQSVTPEDPALIFVDHFGIDDYVTIVAGPSPAFFKHVISTPVTNAFGDMIRIVAQSGRTSQNPADLINATISVALSVKAA